MPKIRLCSASQTRAGILRDAGVEFEQSPTYFDEETVSVQNPDAFVYHVSKKKLETAEKIYGLDIPLLTADTVVADSDGRILRKASNRAEAERILRFISGSEISIITCVHLKSDRYTFLDLSAAHYTFDLFEEDELRLYLDSGEWAEKAGACMVEGFCHKSRTIGSISQVVC